MMYILNLKDPTPFKIRNIFSLHLGLNRGPSDPEADDMPMGHRASLINLITSIWALKKFWLRHSDFTTNLLCLDAYGMANSVIRFPENPTIPFRMHQIPAIRRNMEPIAGTHLAPTS